MGMNYYISENRCDCCKRCEITYHIGKSSWGWAFHFRGYKYAGYTSWKEWKAFLVGKEIVDEEDNIIPYDEFVEMVEGYKAPGFVRDDGHVNISHYQYGLKDGYALNNPHEWEDAEGYAFSDIEFS